MKKSIISPLCSALVVPGLGQVINGQIKKGVTLFILIIILILAGAVEIYKLFKLSIQGLAINELYPEMVISKFKAQNHTILWILLFIFLCIWIYSVIDAYIYGKQVDKIEESNEILSDR